MRKLLFTAVMLLIAVIADAKNIKTVVLTTDPIMHCENCEAKIKENLKYCKGIKSIETSVPNQTVTIQYDADKTTPEAFIKSLKKANYTATEKKSCDKCATEEKPCEKCANADKKCEKCEESAKKTGEGKEAGCCGKCQDTDKKEESSCTECEKNSK